MIFKRNNKGSLSDAEIRRACELLVYDPRSEKLYEQIDREKEQRQLNERIEENISLPYTPQRLKN